MPKSIHKLHLIGLLLIGSYFLSEIRAQSEISWLNWEQGMEQAKILDLPILVTIYNSDCEWCKHMDRTTFRDEQIKDYISKNYIPIKLHFEEKTTLSYKSKTYNFKKEGDRAYNELAMDLVGGRFGTPGLVFMNAKEEVLQSFIGYKDPGKFLDILKYYGEGYYQKIPWHKYQKYYTKG